MPSVLSNLKREPSERSCAQTHGLVTFVKGFSFVAAVYMLCDLLPPLACLSRAFQMENINFLVVKSLVQSTKTVVAFQKDAAGVHFKRLPTEMEKLCSYGFQPYDQHKISKFQKEVYDPYVTALSHNLEAMFPDVAVIDDAFSIFDPAEMPKNPTAKLPSSLLQ